MEDQLQHRVNFSSENLLEDGPSDNRIVYRPEHDYLSLLPSLNLLDPNTLEFLRTYLQSRPKSIRHSISEFYRRHRPRRKKRSREEVEREFENVYHRFWKLQVWVGLLCVLSVVLMVVLILIHPKLRSLATKEKGDDLFVGDGESNTFKLCTKCQPLTSKKGISTSFIKDIQKSGYKEFCCFRRVDQILALFGGYAETYFDQEVDKVRKETRENISSLTYDSPPAPLPLVHVYYKEDNEIPNTISPLTWETRGVEILFQGNFRLMSRQRVTVPETGLYYMYSHLELKRGTTHKILKNKNYKLLSKDTKGGYSYLQGVFRLEQNDKIVVEASHIRAGGRKNYFGIFRLKT